MNTLERLRSVNVDRMRRWHRGANEEWNGADWSNAMCGEAGEAANIVKKLRRHETGMGRSYNTPDLEALHAKLGKELADIIIYADILGWYYGIDLPSAVVEKFNEVSAAQDFPERL